MFKEIKLKNIFFSTKTKFLVVVRTKILPKMKFLVPVFPKILKEFGNCPVSKKEIFFVK